jgi:hypothetical protein
MGLGTMFEHVTLTRITMRDIWSVRSLHMVVSNIGQEMSSFNIKIKEVNVFMHCNGIIQLFF